MNSQSVVICRPTSVSVALDVTCPSFLEAALVAFYDTLWQAQPLMHGVVLTLLLCTGIRNAELLQFRLTDIDLHYLPGACDPGQRPPGLDARGAGTAVVGQCG